MLLNICSYNYTALDLCTYTIWEGRCLLSHVRTLMKKAQLVPETVLCLNITKHMRLPSAEQIRFIEHTSSDSFSEQVLICYNSHACKKIPSTQDGNWAYGWQSFV